MALPISVTYTFATATSAIPLSQLDANFTTCVNGINGIGNGTNALSNVSITGGNATVTTVNATTLNAATLRSDTTLTFQTNGTAEAARFDTSGALLIGNTSAFGAGKTCIYYVPGTTVGLAFLPSTDASSPTPCNFLNAAGTSVGSITTTASVTSYNTSSDYRLKNSVEPMTTGLGTIAALRPVTYKWNADNSDGEGFVAHELQEIIPHAVTGAKDAVDEDGKPIHQGVDYSKIVVHLVAAIQELTAKVAALEAK